MTHASELTSCSWRPDDRAVAFYASSNSIRSSPRVGARCGLPLQAKGPVQGAVVVPLRAHFPNKGPAEFFRERGPNAISAPASVSQDCVHHQPVRASRHDFLDRKIARHSCGLREQQSLC